jgi:hypothetical protein
MPCPHHSDTLCRAWFYAQRHQDAMQLRHGADWIPITVFAITLTAALVFLRLQAI